ncbi:MAG: hypothetical protein COT34_02785 [Candidatus Nealsonbacteria bacterium CG08_land_8_20_14_0_20_43_11]|uniref:Uncharacterized protein n=1 Tax=Candidatus Nealsonbacteria bacterium CG08_land_8_20_14_0_20_43_11 TaxID=1974706 RepID=A0A2M6SZV4_9BACT|nr:MAG: hypothetical protein COT34_02785 [Candidatus Nealsonbacteria bacterium CG08_land_8_20_14_0_20_43_11]
MLFILFYSVLSSQFFQPEEGKEKMAKRHDHPQKVYCATCGKTIFSACCDAGKRSRAMRDHQRSYPGHSVVVRTAGVMANLPQKEGKR